MATLIEKWNFYNDIIKNRENLYIQNTIKDIPEFVYQVWGINGNIRELKITGVSYSNRQYFGFNKRPTKKDVEKIRLFADTPYAFNSDNIIFHYQEKYKTGGGCIGGLYLKDMPNYMTKEEAENTAAPIAEKFNSDELLVSNGTHARCERCRKVVENKDIVHYKIISIATYGHAGRNGKFCSGTCASHEQMAHEG